jgi:hypothetical protein
VGGGFVDGIELVELEALLVDLLHDLLKVGSAGGGTFFEEVELEGGHYSNI